MMVNGYEVPRQIEDALMRRMRMERDPFRAQDLQLIAESGGAPVLGVSNRIADRLIQRERKAGNILFRDGRWSWQRPAVEVTLSHE